MQTRWSGLALALSILLPWQEYAAAPVVDESDNFAVFDSQGVEEPAPVPAPRARAVEEEPLAKMMPRERSQDASLLGQVRALQQEVQSLRGELEVQSHALKQLEQQQMTFYKDIDARLQHPAAPSAPPAVAVEPPQVTPTPVAVIRGLNPADEQVAYLAAYDLVKNKHYPEALIAMQAFVKQYPTGGYTANAEYWIGELYLVKNMPADAKQHFEVVLKQFPTSSKAAASALKVGYALSALGQREEAKQRLKDVIKNYPDTAAAQLAKAKLETM